MEKPKTLEQLRAEKERAETRLAQEQHKLNRLENRKKFLEQGERKKRTHRLCNLGGTVEDVYKRQEVHHPCTFCGKEAMKMQEEVENRTLTLVVSGTKFTGRLLKAAISKYMAHCKEKKLQKQRSRDAPVTPHGKQTVKQLIGQNQGISNIEITDPSIKEFEKIARKYGVDYAVKKDLSLIHI